MDASPLNEQRGGFLAGLQMRVEKSSVNSQKLLDRIKFSTIGTRSPWDSEIYQLSTEVSSLESALTALNHELSLARCGLNRVLNTSSFSCRIPDVLLSDIFAWACTGGVTNPKDEHWTLLAISSVCHHWRGVALRSPSLWACIHIKAGEFDPMMHAYLERSVAATLHLTVELDNSFIQWGPTRIQNWIDSLASYFERCITLKFILPDFTVVRTVFPIRHQMPYLREFSWEGGTHGLEETSPQPSVEAVALYDPTKTSPHTIRLDILGVSFPIRWDDEVVSRLTMLHVLLGM